jgi:hypothetical protein
MLTKGAVCGSSGLKPKILSAYTARLEGLRTKRNPPQKFDHGAEARCDLDWLTRPWKGRSSTAKPAHGEARICNFFRNLWEP